MHFGDALEVQVQAHYALAEYSEREADSETVGGVLTLGRSLSERTYFGLGAAFDDVTYDVSPGLIAPGYERREYFVRFNTAGARGPAMCRTACRRAWPHLRARAASLAWAASQPARVRSSRRIAAMPRSRVSVSRMTASWQGRVSPAN